MALFGRRKPGFSKEVEMKPSEIPGEFSDALTSAFGSRSRKEVHGDDDINEMCIVCCFFKNSNGFKT